MNPLDYRLNDFLDEFLVRCPRCDHAAVITPRRIQGMQHRASLACPSCGYSKSDSFWHSYHESPRVPIFGAPMDPYYRLPVWLQAECCGELLWAYNYRHLAYLAVFVEAKHRDGGRQARRNLSSKLPKWMGLAKNRRRLLKGIQRLANKA